MEWFKEKNFDFKLKDIMVVENFALWIGWQQTLSDEEMTKQYGVILQFPVKEGMLPGVDGTPRDVQTVIKFMRKPEFNAQYPKLGKNTKYVRTVFVQGVEYKYGFSKTSNDKLNAMLALTPGVVPVATFRQTFDKNKQAAQMYDVTVATAAQVIQANTAPIQPVVQPSTPLPQPVVAPVPVAPVPVAPVGAPSIVMSDGEKTIMSSVKGLPQKLTQEKFIQVFVKNMIKPEFGGLAENVAAQRALTLFESQYK